MITTYRFTPEEVANGNDYFSGTKIVQIDRGGYAEKQQVPKASSGVVNAAVEKAVLDGDLWLVAGPTSLFKESIPTGVLTDASLLLPPPDPIVAAAILEANLPAAWKDGKASVAGILAQLSAQLGKAIPWFLVQRAVDGALRARLIELNPDSASWPCDSSGASKVTVKAVSGGVKPISGDHGRVVDDRGFTYRAYLQPNELQDLADSLIKILDLQAKHGVKIRFNLSVEATSDASWHLTAECQSAHEREMPAERSYPTEPFEISLVYILRYRFLRLFRFSGLHATKEGYRKPLGLAQEANPTRSHAVCPFQGRGHDSGCLIKRVLGRHKNIPPAEFRWKYSHLSVRIPDRNSSSLWILPIISLSQRMVPITRVKIDRKRLKLKSFREEAPQSIHPISTPVARVRSGRCVIDSRSSPLFVPARAVGSSPCHSF
jgi:hypothetical protein